MKRKIEDYENKLVAIFCSSIEEWDKINDLLGKKGLTRDYGDISDPDNAFVDCIHINGKGTASKKHYEQASYTIYSASDFIQEDPKFEAGKWYKNYNPPNYMKCDRIDSNYMYGREYISNGIYNKHSNSMYSWDLKTQTLVTDLEEIQEFLPLNHPDKIKSSTSFKFKINDEVKIKPGGCYIADPEGWVKEIHESEFPSEKHGAYNGKISNRKYCKNLNWYKLRNYTNWITEEGLELIETEVIPEYVECIEADKGIQIGNIYKVQLEKGFTYHLEKIYYINEMPYYQNYFKISTKEAFDLQNKPKQLTVDDLIKDEIYVFDISSIKNFISKFDHIDSYSYYDSCFIQKDEFDNEPGSANISDISNIRLATIEEKKWLNTCITQDKFIPKEDLHLYDESGLLIKKEEAMFKKNDYIVVLYNDNSLNSWTNQCFKQLEDLYYLKVVKNLNGNTDGWSVINFKNQSKWRYASSAEILEYERIGKPFDVTTLIKKEKSLVKQVQEGLKLKDRWLKCIKQCDWNTINVGEYIQILENNSLVPYVEWKDNKENYCIDLDRIDKAEFELMPEGFSPNEKEWIPKVGDWVFGTILGSNDYNKCQHPVRIIEIKGDRFRYDLLSNPKTDYSNNESCFYQLNTIVRKASEHDICMHLGDITHNQYPLTLIESFQPSIYDLKDIYIAPIIKKETKIQTTIIESSVDLNLNLTKIKSKQIQTIKI